MDTETTSSYLWRSDALLARDSGFCTELYLENVMWYMSVSGASSSNVLGVWHTPYINSLQYMFINAWFNCAGELLSPCHSVMLALYFGSPALEELAVLDFLSTPPTCYFRIDAAVRVRGDCSRRYWKACRLS